MTQGQLTICAVCPRLCRSACPVATGSFREAATPTAIAAALLEHARGRLAPHLAGEAATLCTDCGACEALCHIDQPLPSLIVEARLRTVPAPTIEAPRPIEGEADIVVIETDPRPLARAVARRRGAPVAVWRTQDRFGVAAVDYPEFAAHAARLRALAGERELWSADGGAARALERAGLRVAWVQERLGLEGAVGSCQIEGAERPLACCGGGGPLAAHHPADAARVAASFSRRLSVGAVLADARCAAHLASAGCPHPDQVDALVQELM